jgi:hypothetical protein
MGWCSATEIMDGSLAAAETVVAHLLVNPGQIWQSAQNLGPLREDLEATVDSILRPFVEALAEKLREGDWDCIEESSYFHRFPQEMLGKDDADYEEWLADQLRDCDEIGQRKELVRKLHNLHEKMGK